MGEIIRFFSTFFLFLIALTSCELPVKVPGNEHDNIWDENNPNYKNYGMEIISGPENDTIIDTNQVTFRWHGTGLAQSDENKIYKYRWDEGSWIATKDTVLTRRWLEEKSYQFEVYAFSEVDTARKSSIQSREFTVDAIPKNSLYVYPRFIKIDRGRSDTIQIRAEDVDPVMGVELDLVHDTSSINILSITEGDFFRQNADDVIFIAETSRDTVQVIVVRTGKTSPTVSGDGVIAELHIEGKRASSSEISLTGNSKFYDQNGDPAETRERVGGIIKVNLSL